MPGTRANDTDAPKTVFRSDRICRVNGEFYYNTREGTQEGPFETREAAEQEIAAYIQRMQKLPKVAEQFAAPVARELAPAGPQSGPSMVHTQ
ncbi:hypothetical protein DOCECA_04565 [Pseudomonas sp. E102]